MATFDCLVDTNPMAASVDAVSAHVKGTTAAVVAMEAAVIAAEKESADRICNNVDKGFFCLIKSQITTKMSQRFSDLNSKFLTLAQLSKSLNEKKDRMENDVARLRGSYYKTFHSIDKSLEHRVYELDKDAAALAQIRNNLITGKLLKKVPEVMCFESESSNTSQMAFTARIKSKTSKALSNLGTSIIEKNSYKSQLSSILSDKALEQDVKEYIPVLLAKEESLFIENSKVCQIYIPEEVEKGTRDSMETLMLKAFDSIPFEEKSEQEKHEIKKEFIGYVNHCDSETRIRDTIMKLYSEGAR